jgi:diguanylate cyclase (GGDEF)-like protein/PAS domain S-box-containing protein
MGRWIMANQAETELFGLKEIDYQGLTNLELAELVHPIFKPVFTTGQETDNLAWSHREPSRYEEIITLPDGGQRIFDLFKIPIFKESGAPMGLVVLGRDITKRKTAFDELRKSQENLSRAQKISHIGSWDWNLETNELIWSDQIYRILGLNPKSIFPSVSFILDAAHPEDRELVKKTIENSIAQGENYQIEHRIIRADQSVGYVNSINQVTKDASGNVVRMVGTVQDITSWKEAHSQLTLAKKAFDEALEGILITDNNNRIIMVNRAFTIITGYHEDEVIGKTPRILKSKRHDREFYKKMWDSLAKYGEWRGEIWNRRKSGEAYPQWSTITTIKDSFGRIDKYIGIFHDLSDIKSKEEELHHQSYHDALTGLPNRKLLVDRLDLALKQAREEQKHLAVISLDLDDFKTINNSMGHLAGDALLQKVAIRLTQNAGHPELICRLGADEFVLVATDLREPEDAIFVASRIQELFKSPYIVDDNEIILTTSLGIAVYNYQDLSPDPKSLIRNADLALSWAKQDGRGKHRFFTETMDAEAVKRLRMENDLRRSLANKEILVHYQPKVSCPDGRILGMEALVRWQKDGKLISPADFIPLAEDVGLIVPIGRYVLEKSCQITQYWREKLAQDLKVAVNVSARQFKDDDLIQAVEDALNESGLPISGLELEVTESALMQDPDQAKKVLEKLRGMGATIALDDFGTGYSSLSYLRFFPIDVLKIDKSFVDGAPYDQDANMLLQAILAMAQGLKLQVVAEGVETADQVRFLHSLGANSIQGYYFSRPLPDQEMTSLLQKKIIFTVD